MASHVALLRGINVGGRNKVPMADLREVVAALGHTGVTTYIQSGNVLFSTADTDTAKLAAALESAIEDRFGLWSSVVVLSRDELAEVLAANPYSGEPNPRLVQKKQAALAATARNLATATKLLSLCEEK
jgi:uncharacterized protein (DUF1697 family)